MTTLNTRNELTSCCKHSGEFLLETSSVWFGKTFRPLGLFSVQKIIKTLKLTQAKGYIYQEPITWSLHTCRTLESTLSDKELFLEQAFPRN